MRKRENRSMLKLIKDPARFDDFWADDDGNCYHDEKGKSKIFCQFHKRTQLKHIDGYFYCRKCEEELEA